MAGIADQRNGPRNPFIKPPEPDPGLAALAAQQSAEANFKKKRKRKLNPAKPKGISVMKSGGKVRGNGCCKRTKKCKMR